MLKSSKRKELKKKLTKMKNKIIKLLLRIPFVKYYYIGKELTKNPPTVTSNGKDVMGLEFVNTTLFVIGPEDDEPKINIENNHFRSTLKHNIRI